MYIFEIPEMAPNLHEVNRVNPGFSAKPFSIALSSVYISTCKLFARVGSEQFTNGLVN